MIEKDDDVIRWGTVWESPGFIKYVVVHVANDQYLLMDYEATAMASTFLKEPKGPLFTEAELRQRLEHFKYIGVRREIQKRELEQAFEGGRQYGRKFNRME